MTKNILVLVDLDDDRSSAHSLGQAIDYARHKGARLHVLNVIPDRMLKMTVVAQLLTKDYEKKLVVDAKQRMKNLLAKQTADDLQVELVVRTGDIYPEVLRYLKEVEADLIVMGSHRPEMKDYLLGSNAAQIVRHAPCSVWVVRE